VSTTRFRETEIAKSDSHFSCEAAPGVGKRLGSMKSEIMKGGAVPDGIFIWALSDLRFVSSVMEKLFGHPVFKVQFWYPFEMLQIKLFANRRMPTQPEDTGVGIQ